MEPFARIFLSLSQVYFVQMSFVQMLLHENVTQPHNLGISSNLDRLQIFALSEHSLLLNEQSFNLTFSACALLIELSIQACLNTDCK